MTHRTRRLPLTGMATASLLAAFALAPAASAHEGIEVGEYLVEIGWLNEPAIVGQPNAVQVTVRNHEDESPVVDLVPGALAVVVSTAGQDSEHFDLIPVFDAEDKTGPLGEYDASLVPTAPGNYTFHIEGRIHGTDVDVTVRSEDGAFDGVIGSSEFEFPAKLPNLTEVATRLDRIDGRIEALQSADPGSEAIDIANAATDAAQAAIDTANRALLFGGLMGGAGLVLAVIALRTARKSGRKGAGPA
ncbi:MAG: hypothetical protein ABIR64_05910 [Candidatus Limnocylindrales bacterium]